jgi:hypothetical protein
MSSAYDPLWMFRLPLSGDVNQRITAPWFSPAITVNYAGDAAIEDRVVTEVASYGKQIGWLTEVAIALANKQPLPAETLEQLEAAARRIDAIKKDIKRSTVEVATEVLDRLERDDPKSYRTLIRRRQA